MCLTRIFKVIDIVNAEGELSFVDHLYDGRSAHLMLSSRCALLPSYKWSTKESSPSAFTMSMTLKMRVKHIPTCRTVKPPALLSSGCNQAAQISAIWH